MAAVDCRGVTERPVTGAVFSDGFAVATDGCRLSYHLSGQPAADDKVRPMANVERAVRGRGFLSSRLRVAEGAPIRTGASLPLVFPRPALTRIAVVAPCRTGVVGDGVRLLPQLLEASAPGCVGPGRGLYAGKA